MLGSIRYRGCDSQLDVHLQPRQIHALEMVIGLARRIAYRTVQ